MASAYRTLRVEQAKALKREALEQLKPECLRAAEQFVATLGKLLGAGERAANFQNACY